MGSIGDVSKREGRLHLVLSWSTKDETGGLDLGEHREKRRSFQSFQVCNVRMQLLIF